MPDRCRHCHKCPIRRHRRGLCWACYYKRPGVRGLYPTSGSPYANRGRDFDGEAPPPEPTDARPGTEAKVAVLEGRAGRGEGLWHPGDAGWEANAARVPPGEGTDTCEGD